MRILSGSYKGLVLKTPTGQTTRPTLSRIKEALFNILNHQLCGSFLELYAGSGSIGLEAFSRGCEEVILVENNNQASQCILHNIGRLKVKPGTIRLIKNDAVSCCRNLISKNKFDYIFLDPPYEQDYYDCWEKQVSLNELLRPKGVIVVQHGNNIKLSDPWSGAKLSKQKKYGETTLSFYQHIEVSHEQK